MSECHVRTDLFECRRPDTLDFEQVLHSAEATPLMALVQYTSRQFGADAGDLLKLLETCLI